MVNVEPKVYLIAEPKLLNENVKQWLGDIGVESPGELLERVQGSDAEKLIELSARRCYKSYQVGLNPNLTRVRTDSAEYHANILGSGHGSVMEHANFTLVFEFVSRVFTHELVRHRAGCAYSQESLRYVRLTELGFWTPPEIARNPEAAALFKETVEYLEHVQTKLASMFEETLQGDFKEKKKITSAFRRLAPEGLATGIVATCNTRALRHIAQLRTSEAAEVEIRLTINKMCDILFTRYPMLFQDFASTEVDGFQKREPRFGKV